MSSSNVFALLDELDKESGMKNPYQLYYHLSTTPSDFSKYNDEGFNVFTWALSQYSKDIFDILDDIYNISVANGKVPDDIINNLDKNGNNIFSIVLRINPVEKRHKTLNMLLQKNFDQEMRDGSDDTPLHIAARRNDLYSIFLLTHNTFISINTVGKNNRTPIYYAIKNQNEIMFEYLLERGAKIKDTGMNINYEGLIYETKNKKLIDSYQKNEKLKIKRLSQKEKRDKKKRDIRVKYKLLCEKIESSPLNEIVKFAKTLNIKIHSEGEIEGESHADTWISFLQDDEKTIPIKKEDLCKKISQKLLIKQYFPNFSFRD